MASYGTSDFKKGLKVQIENEPYLMVDLEFMKPGKGQAVYRVRLCLLYTSPSPRDVEESRMPSSA